MGQKTHPVGFRLSVNKKWKSNWFAPKNNFSSELEEDLKIRKYLSHRLPNAGISLVEISRTSKRVTISIHTARPGIVIGRKGEDIESLKTELSKITKKEVYVEISEVKNPDLDATLVARNVAMQLERRVSHRRAMKRAQQLAMDNGALGFKITAGGRLNGAEIARSESYKEGKIPLHTLRANIDYGTAEANTVAGIIGIKVWICNEKSK